MQALQDTERALEDFYRVTNPGKVAVARQILMRFWPDNMEGLLADLQGRYPQAVDGNEWNVLYKVSLKQDVNPSPEQCQNNTMEEVINNREEELEGVIGELENRLHERDLEIAALKKENELAKVTAEAVCQQATDESTAVKQHNEKIKQQFKKVSTKLRDTAIERDALQQSLETSEETLNHLQAQIMALRRDTEQMAHLDHQYQSRIADLTLQKENLAEWSETLTSQKDTLVTRNEVLTSQNEALGAQIETLATQNESLATQNAEEIERNGSLMAELHQLKEGTFVIQQLRNEKEELVNKATIKTEECASLHAELTKLSEQQQRELNTQKESLQTQILTLADENRGLRDMLTAKREPSFSPLCPSVPTEVVDTQALHMATIHNQNNEIEALKSELERHHNLEVGYVKTQATLKEEMHWKMEHETRIEELMQRTEELATSREEASSLGQELAWNREQLSSSREELAKMHDAQAACVADLAQKQDTVDRLSATCSAARDKIFELSNAVTQAKASQESFEGMNRELREQVENLKNDNAATKSTLSDYETKELNNTRTLSDADESQLSTQEERGHDVISWGVPPQEENAKLKQELQLIKKESQAAIEDLVQRIGMLETGGAHAGALQLREGDQIEQLRDMIRQLEGERDAAQRTLKSYLCNSHGRATPTPVAVGSADIVYELQKYVEATAKKHQVHIASIVGHHDGLNICTVLDELINGIQAKEVRSLLNTFQGSSWEGVAEEMNVLHAMHVGKPTGAQGSSPADAMNVLKELSNHIAAITVERDAAGETAKKWEREAFKAIDYERNAAVLLCKAADEARAISAASALSTSIFLSTMHKP